MELRALIRQMSIENPLWGAPRIHGELLKLGIDVAQSSVAKYMIQRPDRQARGGAASCETTCRTLPPWYTHCSDHWFRLLYGSLNKDAPVSRSVQRTGNIKSHPILGGLHHHYVRV